MLLIRQAQKDALAAAREASVVGRIAAHLREFFPDEVAPLTEDQLRELAVHGIARARSYGITSEVGLCKYANLMATFGRDFDQDPALPWAAAILKYNLARDPRPRIDRLVQEALEHLDDANGLGGSTRQGTT